MPGFGAVDWAIVLAGAVLVLGIGFHFARRQRTTEEYFLAGRNQRPWLAGVSLFSALFTIAAYIGVPGEVVTHGPVLVWGSLAALPFTYFTITRGLIPAFMRLPITSGYELLEGRLGRSVRRAAAAAFLFFRLLWMALILYASAGVLLAVTGCDPRWAPELEAAVGLLATLYTLAGGIEAAMATAALEFFLLLLGALVTLGLIAVRTHSFGAWWPQPTPAAWSHEPIFSLDWHVRVTAVATFVSYFLSTVCSGGSDQVAIQRYLTTRDAAAARRAVLFGHLAVGSVLALLALVGGALLGYYRAFPAALPDGLTADGAGDRLFPFFLSHALPHGLSGLVVAGLLTSAVSGLSPCLNSFLTVLNRDFLERPDRPRTEAQRLRLARWIAVVVGVVVIAGSFGLGAVHGNLVEISGKTVNVFFYPMFALFFFALFVPFATPAGAIFGAAAGFAAAIGVGYWDVIAGGPPVSFQWIGPTGCLTALLAGSLASALTQRRRQPAPGHQANP